MSPAKDPADFPMLRHAKLSRIAWRVYTQRLTPMGRWFALASMGFVSYSGASLQLQGYVPAAYVAAVWLIAACCLLVRPRAALSARLPDRAAAGETVRVKVEVSNTSRRRLLGGGTDWVVIPHRLPDAIDAVEEQGVPLPDLAPGERVSADVLLHCKRRGAYTLHGFRVESAFPFWITKSRRTFGGAHRLLVYPKFSPLTRLRLPTGKRYQPGGVALASEIGESFEYLGNREFREGDNIRDIDWRATARLGGGTGGRPVVREWVEEYMMRVAVVLDTHVPKSLKPKPLARRRDDLERAVSVAASVADHMARHDYLVDLFAAGPDLYHLTAGRSLAYLDQILDILAAVGESPEAPFAVLHPELAALTERLSTVVLVLLDDDEPRRAFAEALRATGVAVKTIVVRDGNDGDRGSGGSGGGDTTYLTRERFDRGFDEL